jgi:hypothetical protein
MPTPKVSLVEFGAVLVQLFGEKVREVDLFVVCEGVAGRVRVLEIIQRPLSRRRRRQRQRHEMRPRELQETVREQTVCAVVVVEDRRLDALRALGHEDGGALIPKRIGVEGVEGGEGGEGEEGEEGEEGD